MTNTISNGSTTTTTRAAVINGYGGPERFEVGDMPLTWPTDSHALVEVAAVSVNPVDLSTRAGHNIPEADALFPMVLGWDVSGTVLDVGADVTAVKVGDRVAAMVFQPIDQRGTYAAHITLDAALLAQVPDALNLQQAATVPLAGLTASQLVDEALTDGAKTLLVTGALGAVGRYVVTLAAQAGVEVLGAVAADRNEQLRALGAGDAVGREAFTAAVLARYPNGVDAAIDLVGGSSSHRAFDAVRDGGRYATAVPPYIDGTGRFDDGRDIEIYVHTVRPDTPRLTELLELADRGVLATTVEATYALAEAGDAHRAQAAGGLSGRIQILP